MTSSSERIYISEAARMLGRSRDTLRRWEYMKVLKPRRDKNDWRYYTIDQIMKFKMKRVNR